MKKIDFDIKYPPSEPCSCEICRSYCSRPGWWTVEQAKQAVNGGYADRMMIEVSPERDFGVLSPAFKGCEGGIALQQFANNGCNFFTDDGFCALHASGFIPLECSFCHHERIGLGLECHLALEKDWKREVGKQLVNKWLKLMQIDKKQLFKGET